MKILNELKKLKIKDEDKLIEYIYFCKNRKTEKYNCVKHHILPKSSRLPFEKYKNLDENPFNRSYMSYYEHYYAHWLLFMAIDNYIISSAFIAMHNQGSKTILNKEDLIDEDEYNRINQLKIKQHSEYLMRPILLEDGTVSSIAKEAAKKMVITKSKSIELADGTISSIAREAQKKTMNKLVMDENGFLITEAKRRGSKCSETKNNKAWKESIGEQAKLKDFKTKQKSIIYNGEEMKLIDKIGKNISKTKRIKGTFYDIHKNNSLIMEGIPRTLINKLSQTLLLREEGIIFTAKNIGTFRKNNKLYLQNVKVTESVSKNMDISIEDIINKLSHIH